MNEKMDIIATGLALLAAIAELAQYNKFNVVIYILLIICIIYIIYKKHKDKKINSNICEFNRELSLCERNLFYSMKNSYKRDQDSSTINSIAIDGLKKYVTIISKILSKHIGKEVTVTIRFIENICESKSNSILTILAYSENCDKEREQYFKPVNKIASSKIVGENTDFELLIGDSRKYQLDFFYESNLQETKKRFRKSGEEYKNTTYNWEQYYNSRIVVPISMTNDMLFFKKEFKNNDIIAFLCADAKECNAFPKKDKEKYYYISLMETFANKLYIILNKYSYYLKCREEGVKHDQKTFRRKCNGLDCPILSQIKKKKDSKIS